jgi:hypothetical protein
MNITINEELAETVLPTMPQSLFEAEQLQFPPVPSQLAALLRRADSTVFATRRLMHMPYDLGHYLEEFSADPDLSPYAVIGFDGHGINSWAAHYYLVNEGLALFIQLPWGGAYLDPEPARAGIAELFDWAAMLQSKMRLASRQQLIPRGRRLQVAASRFSHAGWRWLHVGANNAAVPWNPAEGMKSAIQQDLDTLLDRKHAW